MALDEPDGVAGVAVMRTSEPSLSEQILQYESTGECTAAGNTQGFTWGRG